MPINFIFLLIGAYLLGSVPSAYLAARWSRGIDIRQYGSGNVGATNLLKFTSKRVAIPFIIFDLVKGVLVVWAAQLMGLGIAQQVTVGLAAIIGHNWPIFLRFNGGRGILTTLGVISILVPWLAPVGLVIAFSFAPLRQMALGVFWALVSLPIFSWFLSQPLDIEERLPITLGFVALALIGLSKRLVVPRTPLSKSVTTGQLFINRLLFDRDIRDRKVWISRKPSERQKS